MTDRLMKKLTGPFFLFCLSIHCVSFAQPQAKIDSLENLLKSVPSGSSTQLKLFNQLGFEYWTVDPAQSQQYGEQALQLASNHHDTTELAMAHRVIGVSHWSRGNFIPALNHLYQSQSLYKKVGQTLGEANSCMNIGMVLTDQKDFNRALTHFNEAKGLFEEAQEVERLGIVLNKIGSVYLEQGNTELARKALDEAMQIHRSLDFAFGIMEVSNRLGLMALQEHSLENAINYFRESLSIARSNRDQEHIIKNLENMARVYLVRNELSEAKQYLDEAFPLAQSRSYKKWLRDILFDYKEFYTKNKDYANALLYVEQYEQLKDSIFNEEKAAQLANLRMENEAAEQIQAIKLQKQEIAILEQKKKINQLSILALISTLISIVVAAIFIFRLQRVRYRKRHDIVSRDLVRAKEIEEELKRTLHFKDKELTSYTMNFIRKNELINELGEKIQAVRAKLPNQSSELTSILRLVENNNIDKDWEDFKAIFENVHRNFFDNLISKYPDLTPSELRLCALVHMNLSIKEMAALLGISPDSVKTSRYRLRKKLGLEQGQSLSEFIAGYS